MLSDLILEHKGRAASTRILDADSQRIEITVTARGKVRGSFDVSIVITYWNKPISSNDHGANSQYYYGEGKGIISLLGDGADTATVTEYGIGKSNGQKTMWRGSAFYRTATSSLTSSGGKLAFLNNIAGVFETEVDNVSSDVIEKVWEWK